MQTVNKYDERAAGGIVYKQIDGEVFWLVVKVLKKRGRGPVRARRGETRKYIYKLPKGHLKEGEFLKQAALREVSEEGKVKAEVIGKIGSNNYVYGDRTKNDKIIKRVTFFLMKFVSVDENQYSDAERIVGREWLATEDALRKLGYESEKKLLIKANRILESFDKSK